MLYIRIGALVLQAGQHEGRIVVARVGSGHAHVPQPARRYETTLLDDPLPIGHGVMWLMSTGRKTLDTDNPPG